MKTRGNFRGPLSRGTGAFAFIVALGVGSNAAIADNDVENLAQQLVERFNNALAPDNAELAGFLGDGFQIIGSDGVHFDRSGYLGFPKAITEFEISDLVARRDDDLVTAIFEVGYQGAFAGVARHVPRLARIAVFQETDDGWKLQALAALGTGEDDVDAVAATVLGRWQAAIAAGDPEKIRALASPDFQLQRPDGKGISLDGFLADQSDAATRWSFRTSLPPASATPW
ncbi:MAG: nuclear transport factor 2 family protein [Hyphomicrobiales bacterium]|nr:nuclear transport factor 2 family protein [Hyphomicrobiales bacterium]